MRVITIILVLILIAIVAAFFGWTRVAGKISSELTKKMGVEVTIAGISLAPTSVTLGKMVIGNVPNGILPRAYSADETKVKAPLTRYLSNEIVIEEIVISNIYLGLEFDNAKSTNGNWTTIIGNLENSMASAAPESKPKNPRRVLIKKITMKNISTDLVYRDQGKNVKHLPVIPQMELYNISSEGNTLAEQLADSVLGQMLKGVFIKQNIKNMFEDLLKGPNTNTPLDNFIQPFKKMFPGSFRYTETEQKAA